MLKIVERLCVMLIAFFIAVPSNLSAYALVYGNNGEPMRWHESCAYYTLHQDGAPGIEFFRVQEAIRRAFDHWEDVSCSYFFFEETPPSTCTELGMNENVGNMNLLYFVGDNWEIDADHKWNMIAVTSVSWDTDTGRIFDADIEFNSEFYDFEVDGVHGDYDLENTATHEIGHFLGLQHSTVAGSTMYEEADKGEISKQSLEPDDIDGLCELYPIDEDPGVCLLPMCGLDITCTSKTCGSRKEETVTQVKDSGCSVVSVGAIDDNWWRILLGWDWGDSR